MKYTIILDFDGTVVEHRYPRIGKPVPNALRVLERLQQSGITIVLNTARCEEKDNSFDEPFRVFHFIFCSGFDVV